MGKRAKVDKIHQKIMSSTMQIKVLSDIILYGTDSEMQMQTLTEIINEKAEVALRANEKLGMLFRL